MTRLYFDHAASTPLDPRVLDAMKPYFLEEFGNPGSLHSFGQRAIAAVDASREKIGALLGVKHFREVIFTAGATEANNLALLGAVELYKKNNPAKTPRIIISSIEHESILETARALEKYGVEVIRLPVDKNGIVDCHVLKNSLNDSTVIVSIMYVNNEIGVVQPLAEIKKIIADVKSQAASPLYPLFHTDAVQAFQFFDCNVDTLGVDMMTLSAHKLFGPKGVGMLYVRRPAGAVNNAFLFAPQLHGGGQEFGMRSGTENVPGIVGFATCAEIAAAMRQKESERLAGFREQLWCGIKKIIPTAEINGSAMDTSSNNRAPHILNIYFPGYEAQDLLTIFDRAGIAVSSGSACRSRSADSSYVIEALGYSKERSRCSIRFSLGKTITDQEVDMALSVIARVLS